MKVNLEKAAEIMKVSLEQIKKMEIMANSTCNCPACPTYKNFFKEGEDDDYIGYCFVTNGKSVKITGEKTCICPACPVFALMKFAKSFFCTRDSELQQSGRIPKM